MTFVLQFRKTPEKTSTRKTDRLGIEPGPARRVATSFLYGQRQCVFLDLEHGHC